MFVCKVMSCQSAAADYLRGGGKDQAANAPRYCALFLDVLLFHWLYGASAWFIICQTMNPSVYTLRLRVVRASHGCTP